MKDDFSMPTLSIFFGIVIRMWHDDHPPPHIHAEYQGFEALVDIATGEVRDGSLLRKVAAIVKEWLSGAPDRTARQLATCPAVRAAGQNPRS